MGFRRLGEAVGVTEVVSGAAAVFLKAFRAARGRTRSEEGSRGKTVAGARALRCVTPS